MYRVIVICEGVSPTCGNEAALDITAEFIALGDQYQSVQCEWNGTELILRAESDWDEDGGVTADYFYKCVFACAGELAPNGGVSVQSVEQVEDVPEESKSAEDKGYELLTQATKLEIKGHVQEALLAYQHIADRYSHTTAGLDARKSIEILRA
ncbi:MAG: hypothetical protein K0Q55_4074, partial [Verrucomicrobia bacterium]|nr:hypothetical protein [Verrucomicrobiota bacterium]